MDNANLTIALITLQGLWGLFLTLLTFTAKRLVSDLEKNTIATEHVARSVNALNLDIVAKFVSKDEWNETRRQLHDLAGVVQGIKAREDLRERMSDTGGHRGAD